MQKHPDLEAAVAYLTRFNPFLTEDQIRAALERDLKQIRAEEDIIALGTCGYRIQREAVDWIRIWVDPSLWLKHKDRVQEEPQTNFDPETGTCLKCNASNTEPCKGEFETCPRWDGPTTVYPLPSYY